MLLTISYSESAYPYFQLIGSYEYSVHISQMEVNRLTRIPVQYTLANPSRGVPILKKSVPISEVTILWRINDTKNIC